MDDPHLLLAKALRTLSDEEQGVVLRALLSSTMAGSSATRDKSDQEQAVVLKFLSSRMAGSSQAVAARTAFALQLQTEVERSGERVGLLVRLPTVTHSRLKRWSEEHGYSMNVIVRGLVEQFLNEPRKAAHG